MRIEFDDRVDYFLETFVDGRWTPCCFTLEGGAICSHTTDVDLAYKSLQGITHAPARLMQRSMREVHSTQAKNSFVSDPTEAM